MNGSWLLSFVGMILGATHGSQGKEDTLFQEQLSRDILELDGPWREIQSYCASRVLPLPKVSTLQEWETFAVKTRERILDEIIFAGEASLWRDLPLRVEWLDTLEGGGGYRIRKLRYEAVPGLWIPALLYEPEILEGKVPAVLNLNGHDPNGKSADYKQIRCINQAKRGMLALNTEWVGMGQLQGSGYSHYKMNQLDLCGTSGQGVFFLNAQRGLDLLLSLEHTDPQRVAVTGLSGGGCQTIQLSSLDTRVRMANPVAGYSSFITRVQHTKDLGDSEQTPTDLATLADYTHLTAMMAPRPLLLTYNAKDDCCFEAGYALPPLVEAAQAIYDLYGEKNRLHMHINHNPGTHNYLLDNRQAFYHMLGRAFFDRDEPFDGKEIPCEQEVRDFETLKVPLPEGNADFHSLALELAKDLPRGNPFPQSLQDLETWQQERRTELESLVRYKDMHVKAKAVETIHIEEMDVCHWKLMFDSSWTVPVVEFSRKDAKSTVVLVKDQGRASAVNEVRFHLQSAGQVVVVDPFYFGESRISQRDFLYALALSCVGDRPVGLQASQIAAVCRWARKSSAHKNVRLVGHGQRASFACLVATALETESIQELILHQSLGSLAEVIEQDWSVDKEPSFFCFGLLERFDLTHLACLVSPRSLSFQDSSDRLKKEMAPLRALFENLSLD